MSAGDVAYWPKVSVTALAGTADGYQGQGMCVRVKNGTEYLVIARNAHDLQQIADQIYSNFGTVVLDRVYPMTVIKSVRAVVDGDDEL